LDRERKHRQQWKRRIIHNAVILTAGVFQPEGRISVLPVAERKPTGDRQCQLPVDGRANQACIHFFAKLLKVPRSSVTIASGELSRNKVIRIESLSVEQVKARFKL
jgi:hypothetical protein